MRVLSVLIALGWASIAEAAPPIRNGGNVGLGLGVGTLTAGLDIKYWFNPYSSFQTTIGIYGPRTFDPDALVLGADLDFLIEPPAFVKTEGFDLGMNIGLGATVATGFEALDIVGAHPVVGLAFHIDAVPIDVVIDYRPTLFIVDELEGTGDLRFDPAHLGLHVRYWF